jgi:hypothetical protein
MFEEINEEAFPKSTTDFWDRLESGKYKLESHKEYVKRTTPIEDRHDARDCPYYLIQKCDCYT